MPKHYNGPAEDNHTVVAQGLSGRRAPDRYATGSDVDWMEDGCVLRTELYSDDFDSSPEEYA